MFEARGIRLFLKREENSGGAMEAIEGGRRNWGPIESGEEKRRLESRSHPERGSNLKKKLGVSFSSLATQINPTLFLNIYFITTLSPTHSLSSI